MATLHKLEIAVRHALTVQVVHCIDHLAEEILRFGLCQCAVVRHEVEELTAWMEGASAVFFLGGADWGYGDERRYGEEVWGGSRAMSSGLTTDLIAPTTQPSSGTDARHFLDVHPAGRGHALQQCPN